MTDAKKAFLYLDWSAVMIFAWNCNRDVHGLRMLVQLFSNDDNKKNTLKILLGANVLQTLKGTIFTLSKILNKN